MRLLLIWLLIPIVLIYLISLDLPIPQKRSVYVDRYLLMTLPALLVAVAWGLTRLTQRPSRARLRAAALLLVTVIVALTLLNFYGDDSYWREDWRSALAELKLASVEGDVLLGRPDHLLPLAYYGLEDMPYAELPAAVTDDALLEAFDQEMGRRVALATGESGHAWLITHSYINDVHGFPQERNLLLAQLPQTNLQQLWMDAHYEAVEQHDYVGVRLTRYDLSSPLDNIQLWQAGAQ